VICQEISYAVCNTNAVKTKAEICPIIDDDQSFPKKYSSLQIYFFNCPVKKIFAAAMVPFTLSISGVYQHI